MHKYAMAAVAVISLAALTGCSSHPATASHTTAAKSHATAPKSSAAAASSPAPAAPHTVNPPADAKAAALLEAEDQNLTTLFDTGVSDDNTPAGVTWYTGPGDPTKIAGDIMSTFKQADSDFTADDEPTTPISAWRDSELAGDVQAWYQATGSAQTTAKAQVESDLTQMDADAKGVAAGTD